MTTHSTTGQAAPLGEQMITVNGVDLCGETFGDLGDPAILLINGATTSMYGWPDDFCARLAAPGRFVIRYDQRDTGRSVSYQPGAPGYAFRDLVADAIGLLDHFGIARAHLIGVSMGGGIAMSAALDDPQRVASIILIGTSPGGDDLPPMSDAFLAHISGAGQPDWSDREAVIDRVMAFLRVVSGDSGHLDEAEMRPLIGLDVDRTTNVAASQINHFVMDVGAPIRHRLGEISAPALVIHGENDPVFPLGHAEALQREIPGAELLVLEGIGHELPRAVWDSVIPAVVRHTAAAERLGAGWDTQ